MIAGLLLDGVDDDSWKQSLLEANVLQARTQETAGVSGRMIRQRLELMKPELWELVRDGSGNVLPLMHALPQR